MNFVSFLYFFSFPAISYERLETEVTQRRIDLLSVHWERLDRSHWCRLIRCCFKWCLCLNRHPQNRQPNCGSIPHSKRRCCCNDSLHLYDFPQLSHITFLWRPKNQQYDGSFITSFRGVRPSILIMRVCVWVGVLCIEIIHSSRKLITSKGKKGTGSFVSYIVPPSTADSKLQTSRNRLKKQKRSRECFNGQLTELSVKRVQIKRRSLCRYIFIYIILDSIKYFLCNSTKTKTTINSNQIKKIMI